jgi:hypothetical protein
MLGAGTSSGIGGSLNISAVRIHIQGMSAYDYYFKCKSCGAQYLATHQPKDEQFSGAIDCKDCGQVAYEWIGFYDLVGARVIRVKDPRTGA